MNIISKSGNIVHAPYYNSSEGWQPALPRCGQGNTTWYWTTKSVTCQRCLDILSKREKDEET